MSSSASRPALTDEEKEAVLCQTIDEGFAQMAVGLAVQDQYGTVSFVYAQDEPLARRWRCAIVTSDDEEIERFGDTINEAALHLLNVLRGVE